MSTISYCISVCNEAEELDKLLTQLLPWADNDDEILILVDQSKVTGEVGQVISKFNSLLPNLKIIPSNLNGDFSSFKNEFVNNATKDFIFQIDADELLGEELITDIKLIIDVNPNVDLYYVARENYVTGLTSQHISMWGWKVDDKQRINFPDYQMRIFRNNKHIKWQNKVHEIIVGHKEFVVLPANYFLIHTKDILKQERQNQFYQTL